MNETASMDFYEARKDLLKLLAAGVPLETAVLNVCLRWHIASPTTQSRLMQHGDLYLESRGINNVCQVALERFYREYNQVPQ